MKITEIPLKKVTIAQVIKPNLRGLRTKINGVNFIGTEHFFLKEELATKGFKNRIDSLSEVREVKADTFEYLKDFNNYNCSDDKTDYELTTKDSIIVLDTELGKIGLNYNYYSYFKKLGVKFRFTTNVTPIGMFRKNEFVGVVLPIRIQKNFTY